MVEHRQQEAFREKIYTTTVEILLTWEYVPSGGDTHTEEMNFV